MKIEQVVIITVGILFMIFSVYVYTFSFFSTEIQPSELAATAAEQFSQPASGPAGASSQPAPGPAGAFSPPTFPRSANLSYRDFTQQLIDETNRQIEERKRDEKKSQVFSGVGRRLSNKLSVQSDLVKEKRAQVLESLMTEQQATSRPSSSKPSETIEQRKQRMEELALKARQKRQKQLYQQFETLHNISGPHRSEPVLTTSISESKDLEPEMKVPGPTALDLLEQSMQAVPTITSQEFQLAKNELQNIWKTIHADKRKTAIDNWIKKYGFDHPALQQQTIKINNDWDKKLHNLLLLVQNKNIDAIAQWMNKESENVLEDTPQEDEKLSDLRHLRQQRLQALQSNLKKKIKSDADETKEQLNSNLTVVNNITNFVQEQPVDPAAQDSAKAQISSLVQIRDQVKHKLDHHSSDSSSSSSPEKKAESKALTVVLDIFQDDTKASFADIYELNEQLDDIKANLGLHSHSLEHIVIDQLNLLKSNGVGFFDEKRPISTIIQKQYEIYVKNDASKFNKLESIRQTLLHEFPQWWYAVQVENVNRLPDIDMFQFAMAHRKPFKFTKWENFLADWQSFFISLRIEWDVYEQYLFTEWMHIGRYQDSSFYSFVKMCLLQFQDVFSDARFTRMLQFPFDTDNPTSKLARPFGHSLDYQFMISNFFQFIETKKNLDEDVAGFLKTLCLDLKSNNAWLWPVQFFKKHQRKLKEPYRLPQIDQTAYAAFITNYMAWFDRSTCHIFSPEFSDVDFYRLLAANCTLSIPEVKRYLFCIRRKIEKTVGNMIKTSQAYFIHRETVITMGIVSEREAFVHRLPVILLHDSKVITILRCIKLQYMAKPVSDEEQHRHAEAVQNLLSLWPNEWIENNKFPNRYKESVYAFINSYQSTSHVNIPINFNVVSILKEEPLLIFDGNLREKEARPTIMLNFNLDKIDWNEENRAKLCKNIKDEVFTYYFGYTPRNQVMDWFSQLNINQINQEISELLRTSDVEPPLPDDVMINVNDIIKYDDVTVMPLAYIRIIYEYLNDNVFPQLMPASNSYCKVWRLIQTNVAIHEQTVEYYLFKKIIQLPKFALKSGRPDLLAQNLFSLVKYPTFYYWDFYVYIVKFHVKEEEFNFFNDCIAEFLEYLQCIRSVVPVAFIEAGVRQQVSEGVDIISQIISSYLTGYD